MTVQAVVSNDRRFVRLTVVPFFSTIGAVNTFQFTGSTTTTTNSTRSGLFPNATDPGKLLNQTSDQQHDHELRHDGPVADASRSSR